jgi:hypothetical protein
VETVTFPVTFSDAVGLNETSSVVFCPETSVSGVVKPLSVKSFALTEISEIVKLTFPLFVIVTVLELDVPAFKLPNARLAGLAVSPADAATPLPLRATVSDELGALLKMLMLPLTLPAVLGAKEAVNEALAPAAMLVGVLRPLTLKPFPLTVICETVNKAVPVFVMLKVCDFVCPSVRLPKLKLDGETDIPACVPVPLNATVMLGFFGSLLAIVRLPVSLPAPVGLNVTAACADWPALIVCGVTIPLTANIDPVTLIEEIVKFAEPVLFRIRLALPFDPAVTVPKLIAL